MNEPVLGGSQQRVMVAMSGGVDSSVAAALLVEAGHHVVGVTMKLWGGESDSGCCSVSDVDDARRVAQQLGIAHHVFNFGDEFDQFVVDPYLADHAAGRTPNPCVECNRHLKFDKLLRRAAALGFDLVATGHHARRVEVPGGYRIARGADAAKDQSYVLYPLVGDALARVMLPLGDLTKDEVRVIAGRLGLRTAAKPDSQDVCFITRSNGRSAFLGDRIPLHPGRVVDSSGNTVGSVAAVELVTIGQRRGLDVGGHASRHYVTDVDASTRVVTVGTADDLLDTEVMVEQVVWSDAAPDISPGEPFEAMVQTSAHGRPHAATVEVPADSSNPSGSWGGGVRIRWVQPQRRVASGQSVVVYAGRSGRRRRVGPAIRHVLSPRCVASAITSPGRPGLTRSC